MRMTAWEDRMQSTLLKLAKQELDTLRETSRKENHIKTGDIRKLSARLFREIEDKNPEAVFDLCEEF